MNVSREGHEAQAESNEPIRLVVFKPTQRAPRRRRPRASRTARIAARELRDSLGRRTDAPIRKSFVRPMSPDVETAPLALIYRGGRNGAVAIKLYLAIVWRCAAPPWTTTAPARAWATLLNLNDPENAGARRVKNALKTLAAMKLIEITSTPGMPNTIRLLDESGDGRPYRLPSTAYTKAKQAGRPNDDLVREMYFKVPARLWTTGVIQDLSGAATVMLLILLAEQAGDGKPVWFSTTEFPRRYSISANSRAAGTWDLREAGLLSVESESLPAPGSRSGSTTFATRRRRKIYRLTPLAQIASEDRIAESQPRRRKRSPRVTKLKTG